MLTAVYTAIRVGAPEDLRIVIGKQRTVGADGSAPPAPKLPYVVLDMLTPPRQIGELETRRTQVAVLIETDGAVTFSLKINTSTFDVFQPSNSGIAIVRDAMIESILAGNEPVTAGPIGEDAIWVAPKPGNNLPQLTLPAPLSETIRLTMAEYRFGENTATFTAEAVARWPDSAAAICGAIRMGLEGTAGLEILRNAGWGWAGTLAVRERDLTFLGLWEDRSQFDFRLNCRSRRIEFVDNIETAAIVGQAEP